jgi:hypothetical protein
MLAASVMAALGYAGGYAWAAVKPGAWLKSIETWNFGIALLILAEIVLLFSPLASPARIAVADQMGRLKEGKIEPKEFDFQFLRWEGGRYGMEALRELATRKDTDIGKMAQDALEQRDRYIVTPLVTGRSLASRLTVYPQGSKLPQSFIQMDWSNERRVWVRPACPATSACDAIVADLDGDGRPEVMIIANPGMSAQVFREGPEKIWSHAASFQMPFKCPAVLEALRQGHFQMQPPPYRWNDIQVGGVRLHVLEGFVPAPACPG